MNWDNIINQINKRLQSIAEHMGVDSYLYNQYASIIDASLDYDYRADGTIRIKRNKANKDPNPYQMSAYKQLLDLGTYRDALREAQDKLDDQQDLDDEDDDSELEALNKRKPTSTTTTVTPGNNNATVTTTTGTVSNTTTMPTTSTGDSITINKGGISNTGVASTQVEGAADNFVVKVTDSTDAVTQAEEALKNKYGSLDGILYFPMDISLYDVTGKNLIEDTTGLDVNITLPIPDELIQYGGNVRIAAIENGQLRDLNVRFTTIDGIACMSFVPPHFSPYVVYVDTNNLAAGQMLDATPKTGDPIHPKWFLAMGMACLSVILFTTGDRKKKIKMA